jgi:Zinc dependent phospholipase C
MVSTCCAEPTLTLPRQLRIELFGLSAFTLGTCDRGLTGEERKSDLVCLQRPSMTRLPQPWRALFSFALVLAGAHACGAYSVLTHEEMVDLLWNDNIQPLLRERFPNSTPDDLKKAHAFAYGGSLVQDMGYYPFGNKYFSDLTHYVRSGDFIVNMIREAGNLDEYAFALGALAHYSSDNMGHPTVNKSVAIEFPKLRKKFGNEVTYEDNPKAHIRTEFGFDMTQVAKNRYTSDRYHDFIGFEVSKPLLERAFQDTYGIPLSSVISDEDLAIGAFRRAISRIVPETTRVALVARKKEIVADTPSFNSRKFRYYLSKAKYQREWGNGYRRPGFGTRVLAFFLKFVPKIGPFKALDFKIPNQKAEDWYVASVNHTLDDLRNLLKEVKEGKLHLANTDFDTGEPTHAGEYTLTDNAYARLLDRLSQNNFQQITPELRQNILTFYADPNAPLATKRNAEAWSKTQERLSRLKNLAPQEGLVTPISRAP